MSDKIFTAKQLDFILNSNTKFNIAEGSVRSGKTVGVIYRFMLAVSDCPGDMIWMMGHTQETVFHNCVAPILYAEKGNPLWIFKSLITWHKSGMLEYNGKKIYVLGARDERAIGAIQGKTMDLVYCNEMTLYPENVIQMIVSRLSMPHSKLFADMNPVQPDHICHKWVKWAEEGDKNYFSRHFTVDDNTFLPQEFKDNLKKTLNGIFYRRNYLGEWCLAEGAIFDFFDRAIHLDKRQKACDFWIAGIDYGASNAFACVVLGVKLKKYANDTTYIQAQAEYYYESKATKKEEGGKRSKTNLEYAQDLQRLFETYPVRCVYLDPSAASFRAELNRSGIRVNDTSNDVFSGITLMTSMMAAGQFTVYEGCKNLIREIEGYCWDPKSSARGIDEPLKKNDHSVDATRYALMGFMKGRPTLDNMGAGNMDDPNFGKGLGQRK